MTLRNETQAATACEGEGENLDMFVLLYSFSWFFWFVSEFFFANKNGMVSSVVVT